MKLKGTLTAIITPFKDGKIDKEGFIKNIHAQLEAGVNGIIGLGTTGEASTQTKEEQAIVISILVKELKGKIPIIVGTSHNSTAEAIERTKCAKDLGADMALVVAPYYNRPTQEGVFRHYEAICQSVDFPIVAYNMPLRTGVNIDIPTMKRIATLKNVVAVKDDINQASEILHTTNLNLLSGDDVWTLPMMVLGASGVVSVISNLVPKKVVAMVRAAQAGDFDLARQIHYELLPLVKAAFIETNPSPIKTMMELAGLPAGPVRLPLCHVTDENRRKLQQMVTDMGLVP
jgi:4-hydroxy-tetrahydrodipicolinate synthase